MLAYLHDPLLQPYFSPCYDLLPFCVLLPSSHTLSHSRCAFLIYFFAHAATPQRTTRTETESATHNPRSPIPHLLLPTHNASPNQIPAPPLPMAQTRPHPLLDNPTLPHARPPRRLRPPRLQRLHRHLTRVPFPLSLPPPSPLPIPAQPPIFNQLTPAPAHSITIIYLFFETICTLLLLSEITLFARHRLSPGTYLVLSVIKATIWTVVFVIYVVRLATLTDSSGRANPLGLVLGGELEAVVLLWVSALASDLFGLF